MGWASRGPRPTKVAPRGAARAPSLALPVQVLRARLRPHLRREEPSAGLERHQLVVTIPPPGTNTVLYRGLFAGAHRWGSRVVPGPKAERAAVVARRPARKLTKTPSPLDDAKESWAAAVHGSAVTRGCGRRPGGVYRAGPEGRGVAREGDRAIRG